MFGSQRAEVSRARLEVKGSAEDAKGSYLLVTTETVRRYLELAGLQRRLAILQAGLEVQRKTLALTAARYEAGLTRRFDVERAQAQFDTTNAEVPRVENAAVAVRQALALLVGRTLENAPGVGARTFTVKPLPSQVPGDILLGRPDVAAADAGLLAQAQAVKVARLQWYPRFVFNLDGGRSRVETQGAALTTNVFGIQVGVTTPIFDAGRIRSTITANEARLDAAAARFESILLAAISEADGRYQSYALLQTQVERLASARDSSTKAATTARSLYQAGATDLLSVLLSESQALTREDEWAQADALRPIAYLDVVRSFGGSPKASTKWLESVGTAMR